MVTKILSDEDEKTIAKMIAERAERGWDLYQAKRQMITKTGEDTYGVPV